MGTRVTQEFAEVLVTHGFPLGYLVVESDSSVVLDDPISFELGALTVASTSSVDLGGLRIPINAPSNVLLIPGQLGCGVWRALIQEVGGGAYIGELDYTSLTMSRVLSEAGESQLAINASDLIHSRCCDIVRDLRPYLYELVLYRNQDQIYVGPVVDIVFGHSSITIESIDLFHWFEKRLVNTFVPERYADLAETFEHLFNIGYGQDQTPNIAFRKRDTGVLGGRQSDNQEFRRVADDMKEISQQGLHFTMEKRTLHCFGNDDRPFPDLPTLIAEDFNEDLTLTMSGADYANDIIVTGNTDSATGYAHFGRRTLWNPGAPFPLITQVFSESNISSDGALDRSASRRLDAFRNPPLAPSGTFSQHAALEFDQLIPGVHVPIRVQVGCVELIETFRLTKIDVSVDMNGDPTEKITPTFQPIVEYNINATT